MAMTSAKDSWITHESSVAGKAYDKQNKLGRERVRRSTDIIKGSGEQNLNETFPTFPTFYENEQISKNAIDQTIFDASKNSS